MTRCFFIFAVLGFGGLVLGQPRGDGAERGVPSLAGFSEVVIFATNSVDLKTRSEVLSGSVVVNDVGTAARELDVGNRANTPAGYELKAHRIKVNNRATVGGDVHYNDLDNNGTIQGNLFTPLPLPVFGTLPPFQGLSGTEGDDVAVGPGDVVSLPADDYGAITVALGGTLIFEGGVYNILSLRTEEGAQLLYDAATDVRVEQGFFTEKDIIIGPNGGVGVPAADVIFYIAGEDGEEFAAEIGRDGEASANFYVPNGTLRIRQNTLATGAFLGKDVIVEVSAQVALDSFFINRPPVAVDDKARTFTGGTVSVLNTGAASVLANDSDPNGDSLLVTTTPVSGPSNGSVTLNADGTFSYTHNGSATTSDSFTYEVCDNGDPVECDTATVFINVAPGSVNVNVDKIGGGSGTVLSRPSGINCGPTCSAAFGVLQAIFLEAIPDSGSVFVEWGGDADCVDGALTPNSDKNCTARFELAPPPPTDTFQVTVNKAGAGNGRVLSFPRGIDCGSQCSASFPVNNRVILEANPNSDSVFVGWSGDPDCLDGVLLGEKDQLCVAVFDLLPPPPDDTFTLRVIVQGSASGFVASNPPGIVCSTDCSADFVSGTNVTLSARPDFGTFVGWGGDCSGTTFSTNVLLDADKTCTATFQQ